MFAPLVTAHHNCCFLISIKSERMSLYNNSATFGIQRVIENNLFRNYFLCWKCLAPTDVIFIFLWWHKVEAQWPWKGEKCKFGFYFSICVDLVFRKEAEPYKGTGPCHDRWQTDCQVKKQSPARVISTDWTSAGKCSFCSVPSETLSHWYPQVFSMINLQMPTDRSFIHSGLLRTFFCTGFCLDPIVPQTWGQPEKGSWSGRELPWDV